MLTTEQKKILSAYAKEYMQSPTVYNVGQEESFESFDEKRIAAIPVIKKLIDNFLSGKLTALEFKETSEKLCRQYPYWGFKSFSGQMQLNQYVNNISDNEKDPILKNSLQVPPNEAEAKHKINELHDFLSSQKDKTQNPKSIPRVSQYFLLSYFWEMQDAKWPVYYGSVRKVLLSLGFRLDLANSLGQEYVDFVKIFREISAFIESEGFKSPYQYWLVEHIFWSQFMKGRADSKAELPVQVKTKKGKPKNQELSGSSISEWIPGIVNDLIELSHNRESKWSLRQQLRPDKAFETKLRYAFTLLGYETEELGQGTGREPDGVALSMGVMDGDYAIVYDAKARESHFSIGTSDREIFEYIQNKKDVLRRKKRIHKLYYLIVSSDFDENLAPEALRSLYRRTQVPITLIRASDLLFTIDSKLQNVDIDHSRLEDLFLDTGVITREKISDILGVR